MLIKYSFPMHFFLPNLKLATSSYGRIGGRGILANMQILGVTIIRTWIHHRKFTNTSQNGLWQRAPRLTSSFLILHLPILTISSIYLITKSLHEFKRFPIAHQFVIHVCLGSKLLSIMHFLD